MSYKWDQWLYFGGDMPTLDLPDVPPPITDDDHIHVYVYVMEEDEDGGVLDSDVCKICGKEWEAIG